VYLLFSDIHANKQAAQDIQKVAHLYDTLICAGDVCGYDLDFEYVIDMLQDLNVYTVRGNHDNMVLDTTFDMSDFVRGVSAPILRTREKIRGRYLDYLENLPTSLEVGNVFVKHTLPNDDYVRDEIDAWDMLHETEQDNIVIGHTHTQDVFRFAHRKIINPGSITKGRCGHSRGYAVLDGDSVHFEKLESIK